MTFTLSTDDIKRCREISLGNRDLIMDIVRAVAEHSEIPVAAILGPRRTEAVVQARWMIFRLAHEAGHSSAAIARAMRKDHSTVLNGIRMERERLAAENGEGRPG